MSFRFAPWVAKFVIVANRTALAYHRRVDWPTTSYAEAALVFAVGYVIVLAIRSITPVTTPTSEAFWNF